MKKTLIIALAFLFLLSPAAVLPVLAELNSADAIRIPDNAMEIADDFADPGAVLIVPSDQWAQWAQTHGYRWVYDSTEN